MKRCDFKGVLSVMERRNTLPRAAGFQPAVRDVRRSQPRFPHPFEITAK